MGIPRFATRMRDYARRQAIGSQGGRAESIEKTAIIDGPSLAHCVFRALESNNHNGAIGIAPDYAAIWNALLAWLARLEAYGFTIEGIYFDGALPVHKKEVRLQRLQSYVDRLVRYKIVHDELSNAARSSSTKTFLMSSDYRLKQAEKDLPAPPFLVSAIVEALFASSYADRTWLVSGEADPFCVVAAQEIALAQPGAEVVIFTNDSDLIVYNSGSQTKVAMIDSLSERELGVVQTLEATVFWPQELRKLSKEHLKDLVGPAHAMVDPYVTFTEALKIAWRGYGTAAYNDFAETFSTTQAAEDLSRLKASRTHGECMLQGYSKLTELMYQAQDTSFRGPDSTDLYLYLSVSFEDPTRSTAWVVGTSIREVAMWEVKDCLGLDSDVFEYRKLGQRIAPVKLEPLSRSEVQQRTTRWESMMKDELAVSRPLSHIQHWRFLLMQMLLLEMVDGDMKMPNMQNVLSVLKSSAPTTWEQVHFLAHYQALYYSLGILHQVLDFTRRSLEIASELKEMFALLADLPGVAQICNPGCSGQDAVDAETWQLLVEGFASAKEIQLAKPIVESSGRARKPKKKKVAEATADESTKGRTKMRLSHSNPFAALAEL